MDSMVVTYVTRVLKNAMYVIHDISSVLLKEGSRRPVLHATWVPTHPDAESYGESKHGVIYHKEEDHFDFNRPLSEVRPGKDYRTPTCQFCHMYEKHGRFIHNPVMKGIWRMGTIPPKNLEYTSSLKDYPYGINIIPDKIDIYSEGKRCKEVILVRSLCQVSQRPFCRYLFEIVG